MVTVRSCARNRGTNRNVMLSTRLSAGMLRPQSYTNLSDVTTALKQENHKSTDASIMAAASP